MHVSLLFRKDQVNFKGSVEDLEVPLPPGNKMVKTLVMLIALLHSPYISQHLKEAHRAHNNDTTEIKQFNPFESQVHERILDNSAVATASGILVSFDVKDRYPFLVPGSSPVISFKAP